MKKITRAELEQFRGQNGAPIYVVYQGKVYDLSASGSWDNGMHQDLHAAGQDLTEAMNDAPHADDVLKRFPVVGEIDG